MLDYLGVPYIQSAGEAEAMCAFLNRNHVRKKQCIQHCFRSAVAYCIFCLSMFVDFVVCYYY